MENPSSQALPTPSLEGMGKKGQGPSATRVREPFASQALVGLSPDELLDKLAVPHLERAAYWRLFALSASDNSVARRGLRHPNGHVRANCCQILDHFLDDIALAEVLEHVTDDDPRVRWWALHTLGCDRCKEGSCRPGEAAFVPAAIDRLANDPIARVRLVAVTTLGPAVERNADVTAALERAVEEDDDRCRAQGSSALPREASVDERLPEHHADPRPCVGALGDAVLPCRLCGAAQHEQVTGLRDVANGLTAALPPHEEPSG